MQTLREKMLIAKYLFSIPFGGEGGGDEERVHQASRALH
jgi:hypothetical protein